MSDNLKKYIEDNRLEADVFSFDVDQGWEELRQRLPQTPKKDYTWLWKVAASVSLLISISTVLFFTWNQEGNNYVVSEVSETEKYYQSMVDAKLVLVKDRVDPEILMELEEMDRVFEELKSDLADDVDNEEVIAAMIDNYRLKLKILERILEELDDETIESENKSS